MDREMKRIRQHAELVVVVITLAVFGETAFFARHGGAQLETGERIGAVCEPWGKSAGTRLIVSSAPSTQFVTAY